MAMISEETRPYNQVANIFPLMEGDQYEQFKSDIAANGLLEAIWLHPDGSIIDGRNRHRACLELGIEPRFRTWSDTGSLVSFVVSLNLMRRHMNEGQRALVGDAARPFYDEEARVRQITLAGTRLSNSDLQENLPEGSKGQARDKVAKDFGTNGKYIDYARKLRQKAPDLAKKVEDGEISMNFAMRQLGKREAEERQKKRAAQGTKQIDSPDDPPCPKPKPRLMVGRAECLSLPDESVDIVITSPPYNLGGGEMPMGGHGRVSRAGIGYEDSLDNEEYVRWQLVVFAELYRVSRVGASLFYNHKTRTKNGALWHPMTWLSQVKGWTLRQEIVWDREVTHNHSKTLFWPVDERIYWFTKGKPVVGADGIGMPSVWRFHGPEPHTWHPAPFSEELPRRCLQAVGRPGAVVLDPFAGSCTTLRVALAFGYEAVGVDVNAGYLEQSRALHGW